MYWFWFVPILVFLPYLSSSLPMHLCLFCHCLSDYVILQILYGGACGGWGCRHTGSIPRAGLRLQGRGADTPAAAFDEAHGAYEGEGSTAAVRDAMVVRPAALPCGLVKRPTERTQHQEEGLRVPLHKPQALSRTARCGFLAAA